MTGPDPGGFPPAHPVAGDWRLRLVHAANIRLAGDPSLEALYHTRFEGAPPRVRVRGGVVAIEYGPRFRPSEWGRQAAEVALSTAARWRIEAPRGLEALRADLRALRLLGLEVQHRTFGAELHLARPVGTVTLRFGGGVGDLSVHRPAGAAAALLLQGGASRVTFDDQFYKAVGGEAAWKSADFERAADRYEIVLASGARDIVVDEADPGEAQPARRLLTTVLFSDIVGSTELAARVGDRRWRELLDRHDEAAARLVEREGGRLVKTTGDGVLAVFDAPGRAIGCAAALRDELLALGIQIRSGLHTGEVELRGDDVGGIAVHIAARVMAAAGPGEVLVSRTVRDLVTGSGVALQDRGAHTLKGVADPWQLYAAV